MRLDGLTRHCIYRLVQVDVCAQTSHHVLRVSHLLYLGPGRLAAHHVVLKALHIIAGPL